MYPGHSRLVVAQLMRSWSGGIWPYAYSTGLAVCLHLHKGQIQGLLADIAQAEIRGNRSCLQALLGCLGHLKVLRNFSVRARSPRVLLPLQLPPGFVFCREVCP